MDPMIATSRLGAFLPARDFGLSCRFYEALGFTNIAQNDEVGLFLVGTASFVVTRVYDKQWDGAFMMALMVDDLSAWWERIRQADLPGRFGTPPPSPPAMQPWGLEVSYVVDPSGVLWHFQQRPANLD